MMRKLLKEPLLHFLAVGAALFVLFDVMGGDRTENEPKVIEVNRDALLAYLQYRSRAFESSLAEARLRSMPKAELERLIADYVREEALHREALALGMDQNDYIIKRRLVQSIEFITAGFATAGLTLSDDDIEAYYRVNRQRYFVEPFVTFTHVFFDKGRHTREEASSLANAMVGALNERQAAFSEAPRHGDRFAYAVNYVEREPGFVAGHFGPEMAKAVFELEPNDKIWRGPFESPHGFHVILLTQKAGGRYPELAEIRKTVAYDAERDAVSALTDTAIQAIVDTYEVRRELGLSTGGSG